MNPWMRNLLCGGGGGGGGVVLPPAGRTFLMSKSSLILDEGTGGPTWSRATKAWGFNELGYLEELASGCAFFGGARLVRNNVRTKSEDFSNAAWAKTAVTVSGTNTIVCANATSQQYIRQTASTGIVAGMTFLISARVKYVSGGADFIQIFPHGSGFNNAYCNCNLQTGAVQVSGCTATVESVTGGGFDVHVKAVANTSGAFDDAFIAFTNALSSTRLEAFVGDGIKSFELLRVRSCDVTGYDASYVPEYVSVGVSRNEIINTEDPSNASWTMVGGIGTKTAIITDGPNGNQINVCRVTVGVSATGLRMQGSGTVTSGAKISGSVWVRKISGSGTQITMDLNDAGTAWFTINSVWQQIQLADISHASVSVKFIDINISAATWTTGDIIEFCYPQYNYGSTLNDYTVVGGSYVYDGAGIDGAKYFETDWQRAPLPAASLLGFRREASATNNLLHSRDLSNAAWSTKTNVTAAKTATGLDGIANTATTLTAAAAGAIILQPITLASAASCASAYVKRRTGTGTISFTQDGGGSWTDITAQINGSTWSRVQITSTLANPSVGFKISTSGDAIDVDCVQNEAGAVATSPIVTTTGAVTRNADSLAYQTASNIDAALGTLFCEYSVYEQTSAAPRAIIGLSTAAATANALLLHATGVATPSLSSGDGTTIFAKTGLGSAVNTKRKAAVSWGTGRSLTAEGLATQSGGFSGTLPSVAIAPGAYTNGTFPLNGYIGPVAIYNYQITDAELQALTT